MTRDKTVEVDTAGADQSTIVHAEEGDTQENVLQKAFHAMDEAGDAEQFQLRQGTGEPLEAQNDLFQEVPQATIDVASFLFDDMRKRGDANG